MVFYHGTSAPNLQKFQLRQTGYGEQEDPINCIWVSTDFEAAKYHAQYIVAHKRKTSVNYVYSVNSIDHFVMADTKFPEQLSPEIQKKIFNEVFLRPLWLLPKSFNWVQALAKHIEARGIVGDEAIKNEIFELLASAGVDALQNPNFNWHKHDNMSFEILHYNPSVDSTPIALLNIDKFSITGCTPV
jgi:hypothetical protein